MILGGLALKLGEAGVEPGVLRQDRGDQESNLQAKHLINSSHRGCGHIWLTPLGKAGVEAGVEAGVLQQNRRDQESHLQAEHLVNSLKTPNTIIYTILMKAYVKAKDIEKA